MTFCKKCKVQLVPGYALEDVGSGISDFIGGEVVTMSPSGKAELVPCMKCPECGYSVKGGAG